MEGERFMIMVEVERLREFSQGVFEKVELSAADAHLVSDTLVEADLCGVHSHGMAILPRWARGFSQGQLNKRVECPVLMDAGALCLIDGQNGLGVFAANKAMELATQRAAKYGIAIVGVRNSSHFGMAAYYTKKALAFNQIGFCTTNGPAVMAPWGAREALLCNNPFSYAIPTKNEFPVVLDMACSASARGKIRLKARDNQPIPEGWAINAEGEPTTDASEALEGALLPFGEYKGYGMAVINEILSAALTGAQFSFSIPYGTNDAASEVHHQVQPAWGCGHLVGAIDIGKLVPIDEFKAQVDILCEKLKSAPKAPNFERVYIPGEIEYELKTTRLQTGIPLAESTISLLNTFAKNELEVTPLI
jgi:LDH2 family malate/lactate/ureidoglycolate dehydrogenase